MQYFITTTEMIGMTVFVLCFLPQVIRTYRGKHTIGMNATSWFLNWFGRFLWVPYAMFMPVDGVLDMGLVMLIGQGLIAALNIPIVYYSARNRGNSGRYTKDEFTLHLFVTRIALSVITFSAIIVCTLAREGVGFPSTIDRISSTGMIIAGLFVTFVTAIAFLPQTILVLKTKVTTSISLKTTLFFAIGNSLLIVAMICNIVNSGNVSNLGAVILGTGSTALMYITSTMKIINMKKLGEK